MLKQNQAHQNRLKQTGGKQSKNAQETDIDAETHLFAQSGIP